MTEKTDAVQRMQDYIEKHLEEEISFADLAEAAHFSPWYSARIFKELKKITARQLKPYKLLLTDTISLPSAIPGMKATRAFSLNRSGQEGILS